MAGAGGLRSPLLCASREGCIVMTRDSAEKNDGRMVGVIAVLAGLRRWRVGDAVRAGGEVA